MCDGNGRRQETYASFYTIGNEDSIRCRRVSLEENQASNCQFVLFQLRIIGPQRHPRSWSYEQSRVKEVDGEESQSDHPSVQPVCKLRLDPRRRCLWHRVEHTEVSLCCNDPTTPSICQFLELWISTCENVWWGSIKGDLRWYGR